MPRLWLLSDLHLEAVPHPEAFRPVRPAFDVLVAAGDLWEGSSARAIAIVAALAGGKPAVFVLGNHEPWHRDLAEERAVAIGADQAVCAAIRLWRAGLIGEAKVVPIGQVEPLAGNPGAEALQGSDGAGFGRAHDRQGL